MTLGESISTCFRKYAVFEGRASRSEYWWWVLFNVIVSFCTAFFFTLLLGEKAGSIISNLVSLAFVLPSISVLVRRLHDTDHSGWYYWVALIPLVGWIWLLVLLCKDSDQGENEYGWPDGVDPLDYGNMPYDPSRGYPGQQQPYGGYPQQPQQPYGGQQPPKYNG